MFRKTDFRITRWLFILSLAAFVAACNDEPDIPLSPVYPPEPPADGYVWREIPEIPDVLPAWQEAVTHFITVKGKKVRNFSMLYDAQEKLSYWVAYPMHSMYTKGDGTRSDDFIYDPYFSAADQMPITGNNYYRGYQRGHQIASADRYVTQEANNQTFYVTNMTPQNGTLNGGQWATLEGWVRSKATAAGRSDTLYVVSGCVIKTAQDPAVTYTTVNGVSGAVPKAYYKVLLRTVSGDRKVPTDDDAMCIGVWMENRAPSGNWQNYLKSVSDIEALSGNTFFPAISSTVKDTYSTSAWGIY